MTKPHQKDLMSATPTRDRINPETLNTRPLRRPIATFYDGWERLAARLVDRVITVGDVIAARFGPRVIIVRNLPDLDRLLRK
jgi:hypothetical protein